MRNRHVSAAVERFGSNIGHVIQTSSLFKTAIGFFLDRCASEASSRVRISLAVSIDVLPKPLSRQQRRPLHLAQYICRAIEFRRHAISAALSRQGKKRKQHFILLLLLLSGLSSSSKRHWGVSKCSLPESKHGNNKSSISFIPKESKLLHICSASAINGDIDNRDMM